MKLRNIMYVVFAAVIVITGCASPFKWVKSSNVPFERRDYSILPPQEPGWEYAAGAGKGRYTLMFRKKDKESETHTFVAKINEIQNNTTFSSTEEFLFFVKKSEEQARDLRRYRILEEKMSLDDRFGSYCIVYYSKVEDHEARQKGKSEFLILTVYEYIFIHPNNKNIIINVGYSERGTPDEIDPKFIDHAQNFINGLKLK